MKKLLALSLLALPLIGCTRSSQVVETTFAAPTTVQPTESTDTQLVNAVIESHPDVVNRFGKIWIVDFARILCANIDDGMSAYDLRDMGSEAGVDPSLLATLTVASIQYSCPWNQWFLDAVASA